MRKILIVCLLALFMVVAIFGWIETAQGQSPGEPLFAREVQETNVREAEYLSQPASPDQPDIGFIDSPSSTCYQPDPGKDDCYMNWYYLSVDANPNYMIAMTVTLNTIGPIARIGGFFQTSMYVPYNMFGDGFKVACGSLGAGGVPTLGNAYSWTINARDSSNLKSANYGTSYCPAFAP